MPKTKNEKDIKLLREAADKYDKLAESNGRAGIIFAPIFEDDCALCACYFKGECARCPIKLQTGNSYCNGTPHDTIQGLMHKLKKVAVGSRSEAAIRASWKRSCRRQAEFLRKLADSLSKQPAKKKAAAVKKPAARASTIWKAVTGFEGAVKAVEFNLTDLSSILPGKPSAFSVGTVFSCVKKGAIINTTTMIKSGPQSILFFNAATHAAAARFYATAEEMDLSVGKCVPFSAIKGNV